MMEEVVKNLNKNFLFVNSRRDSDFPQSFVKKNNIENTDLILNEILTNIVKNDVIVVSVHKGRFNRWRDRHVDLKKKFRLGKKAVNLKNNLDFFIKSVHKKGGTVILIVDTPLLKYITPIENCYLQEKIFRTNDCSVKFDQDKKTAENQVSIYENLKFVNTNVFIFNPNIFLYENQFFNPISQYFEYKMVDWHHLNQIYSKEILTRPFLNFLKNNIKN